MRKTQISGVVIGAMLALGLSTGPALAAGAGDADITVGDSTCDLTTAGLGAGISTDAFRIGTAKQLAELNDCKNGYRFVVLTADIDLTPSESTDWNKLSTGGWMPIGDSNTSFQGYVNGQNHSITNLTINSDSGQLGLFGDLYTANLKNFTISGSVTQTSGASYAGAIAGDADYLHLTNITSNVQVTSAGDYLGGLVGSVDTGNFKNLVVNGDVVGTDYGSVINSVGGVVGYADPFSMDNVIMNGDVHTINEDPNTPGTWSNGTNVGGLIGQWYNGSITNSVMNGDVSASQNAGGLLGYAYYGAIDGATMNGNISADNRISLSDVDTLGGIAGYWGYGGLGNATMNGGITVFADDTNSTGGDQEVRRVGGLVGDIDYSSVADSEMTGDISVDADGTSNVSYIGGISGDAESTGFVRVVNSGDIAVEGADNVGGIVGQLYYGSIIRSVNSGDITVDDPLESGDTVTGGFIGYADDAVIVEGSANTGNITVTGPSSQQVGGMIGYTDDSVAIHDSYNRGNISAASDVAGIIGVTDSEENEISNSYTTGTVTATDTISPVSDVVATGSWVEPAASASSTFDTQTTGNVTSATGVVGNTTADMKTESTFVELGWSIGSDNSVWKIDPTINDGYPYIAAAVTPDNGGGNGGSNGGGETASVGVRDLFGALSFKKGTSKLTKASKVKLNAYATALKAEDYDKVTVKVYTKSTNTKLAVKRAKAVAKYLKAKGVTVKLYKEAVTRASKKKNNKAWIIAVKNPVV